MWLPFTVGKSNGKHALRALILVIIGKAFVADPTYKKAGSEQGDPSRHISRDMRRHLG